MDEKIKNIELSNIIRFAYKFYTAEILNNKYSGVDWGTSVITREQIQQLFEKGFRNTKLDPSIIIVNHEHGMDCYRCKIHNEYAEPNQLDGSFICYECRNRL